VPKTKSQPQAEYKWPHPRFHKSTDKKWLEGRTKHVSGFCTPHIPLRAQGHEGEKPVSDAGEPRRTCHLWQTCPCTCHKDIDDMCEMAGIPREPAEQSMEYMEKVHASETATRAMLDAVYADAYRTRPLWNPDGPDTRPDDEGPATGTLDPATGTPAAPAPAPIHRPVFTPTPTGRRARGQLEYDVLQVCREYVNGVYEWDACTPKAIAERIGAMNATEPPSTGAINAVWDRWEKIGFAEQAKKPSRFVKFTGESSDMALDRTKGASKRAKKSVQAELKRGIPRPRAR
jgi:hypothetical protein